MLALSVSANSVSLKSNKNKMSVFNLGVVFGPTLLRAVEETLAAILDIKFNNVVIEILIENYDVIFKNAPGKASDYLVAVHGSPPPEPVPRSYSGYHHRHSNSSSLVAGATLSASSSSRMHHGRLHAATGGEQPVMRVTARSQYTDPIMSSSLQSIPNGVLLSNLYQNTSGGGNGGGVSASPPANASINSANHITTSPHKSPKSQSSQHHPQQHHSQQQQQQHSPHYSQHQQQQLHFQQQHAIYDTHSGSSSNAGSKMNQSTPALIAQRDFSHSARNLSISGASSATTGAYTSPSHQKHLQQHHQQQQHAANLSPNHHRAATDVQPHLKSPAASGYGSAALRTHSTNMIGAVGGGNGTGGGGAMSRSTNDGIYAQSQRLQPIAFSESNLIGGGGGGVAAGAKLDRIHSTSSSNESVCSASSLQLQQQQQKQHHLHLQQQHQQHQHNHHQTTPPQFSRSAGTANNYGPLSSSDNYGTSTSTTTPTTGIAAGGQTATAAATSNGSVANASTGGGISPFAAGNRCGMGSEASHNNFMPKKTQRSKEAGRQLLNWNRENV